MTLASHRDLFKIPRDVAYFNNASSTPLPHQVRQAGARGVATKARPWQEWDWQADVDAVRAATGALVGAAGADIALVPAAAYGVAVAAANIRVAAGDRILMIEGEFPSLAYAWARVAEERGAVLDLVARPSDGDWTAALQARIAAPGPPVAVAALTPTVWTDGTLIDLARLAPALHAQGAAIVIDATQAAGVLPLDVVALHADYLVFPCYKWLLGPYTLAFLYVAPHRQAGRPLEQHGAGRTGGTVPFGGTLAPMVDGAARFDMGERLNPVTIPMALAGLRLLEGWGRDALVDRLRRTTDALADLAEAAGLAPVPRGLRSPHVLGLRMPAGTDPATLVSGLAAAGVFMAERGGVVRLGAHVFNDEADVARFGAALPRVLSAAGGAGASSDQPGSSDRTRMRATAEPQSALPRD